MSPDHSYNIQESWRRFLLEEEAIKHYPQVFLMHGFGTHRDVLLEEYLPSLLYIKAVALFDDALEELMLQRSLSLPTNMQHNLNNRINFLASIGLIADTATLHHIRVRRNELAHDSAKQATWIELAADRSVMHSALQALGLIGPPKELEFYCERSAMRESSREGYTLERDYKYGVRETGALALEVQWIEFLE